MFKKFMATFCTLVFSAMLAGCGTQMGQDISSDISSLMPDASNGSSQNNNSSYQSDSGSTNQSGANSQVQNSSTSSNHTSSDAKITKEKAKEIALNHAKVKESDIRDYEIDLDTEEGVLIYDISFEHNGKEYDYDIDATTGKITNSMYELVD